jgi:peptide subunit release factor 1 (eRF1)
MPKHAHSLTRDIRELANTKALQLYKGNLKKIKIFQWSKLQDLLKTDRLKNSLKKKIIPQGRTNKKR